MTPMRLSLSLLLALAPVAAAAQSADTLRAGIPLPARDSTPRLPADRVEELIQWERGGGIDADGRATWHARGIDILGRRVDGVSWGGVIRRSSLSTGVIPLIPSPAFNAIGSAELLDDAYSVTEGSDGPGLLRFTTRPGGDRWEIEGSAESGEPFGPESGPGNSRFTASAGGPLAAGWRFRTAGVLHGRISAPTGIGYGASPYYLPSGIDTTFTWAVAPGDSVTGFVQTFIPTDRIPTSPRTTSDLYARLDGRVAGISVWSRYLRSSEAQRDFSFTDISNPAQTFGRDGRTQDFAVGATLPRVAGWVFSGHLSWQEERSQSGPIDPAKQLDSRDPALGLMLDGPGLRYTFETFPVDDELMWNYRGNIANSRRSPYDLENTDQYRIADNFRNNPYAVNGFSESGGPQGVLKLYRDRRVGAQVAGAYPLGDGGITVGAEARVHQIDSYRHALSNQLFSDVWREKPVEQALFADWTTGASTWLVSAGARIDRFDTRARRPRGFPRIRSMGADLSGPDREAIWDSISVADKAHSAFSARVTARGEVSPGVWLRGHVGRFARTPDLGVQLGGINTDLAMTNVAHQFGTDYGHELTDVVGIGVSKVGTRAGFDAELFRIRYSKVPVARLVTLYDPVRLSNTDIVQVLLLDGEPLTGGTLGGHVVVTPALTLRATWSHYFELEDYGPFGLAPGPSPDAVRPNSLTLLAEFDGEETGSLAGLGAVVSVRRSSALARAFEPEFEPYDPFTFYGPVRSSDIPAWTSLDLRVTKTVALAGGGLTLFVDGRNLLNAENLLRAFRSGDPTSSQLSEQMRFAQDSSGWSREASNNGVYNNGDIELTFGFAGCGAWLDQSGSPAPPNCGYLINAEARFGDGDGTFSIDEQRAASNAYYRTTYGRQSFNGPPREIRVGAQFGF